ncbi:MAG: GTP cyclohydrolase II [Planctomycetota bacterium]|nr:MAG: GTP cyclohydrolase II [Planctomycetota bacterium]
MTETSKTSSVAGAAVPGGSASGRPPVRQPVDALQPKSGGREVVAATEDEEPRSFDSVEDAVEALRGGRMIIVVDPRERENEGDFICAAETITAEQVDFMLRYGRGQLCAPLTKQTAQRLQLTPVVDDESNTAAHRTPFLVPVDHRLAGTGVSAESRALTIRALADERATPEDFVRPGHVSPLLAKEGGVLRRSGHTEATIDLLRLAGMKPVGALIEILSPSGTGMADIGELQALARRFDLPMISIEDLIRHRRLRERLVHREAEVVIETRRYGPVRFIAYRVDHENQEPLAMVWGDLQSVEAPLVRMHSSCFTGDVFESLRCDCGDQLHLAMEMIHREGTGAVIYLPQEGRGIGLVAKLKAYMLQDQGLDTVEANRQLGYKADQRDYMIGLQILKDLGLTKVRLLTNNPKKIKAFPAWDLQVVEQVPIIAPPARQRLRYMQTKRDKLGHLLPPDFGAEVECCGRSHGGASADEHTSGEPSGSPDGPAGAESSAGPDASAASGSQTSSDAASRKRE